MKSMIVVGLLALSLGAMAQAPVVTDEPAKKPIPKKAEAKKVDAKKAVAPKKPAPAKKPTAPPKTTVYKNDPNAPVLRDKQGNVIPTDPNAYDVSSAIGKK